MENEDKETKMNFKKVAAICFGTLTSVAIGVAGALAIREIQKANAYNRGYERGVAAGLEDYMKSLEQLGIVE
jgi:hypothetical protein